MEAKLDSPMVALAFMFAGKAIFTLRSLKTGARFTYRVEASKPAYGRKQVFFVSVLTGPDNMSNFVFFGTIFEKKMFRHSLMTSLTTDALSVVAFKWAFEHLVQGSKPCNLEIWHEGKCGRCGRRLTVPESIELGLGPECAEAA